jgi:hypothetical protein
MTLARGDSERIRLKRRVPWQAYAVRPTFRYYVHGDESETDRGLYYCHCCDVFLPASHFVPKASIHPAEQHLRAENSGLIALARYAAVAMADPWRRVGVRPLDPPTVFPILPPVKKGASRHGE